MKQCDDLHEFLDQQSMISSLKAMHVGILRILAYTFFNRYNKGLHHLQPFLNIYHSWKAGGCFLLLPGLPTSEKQMCLWVYTLHVQQVFLSTKPCPSSLFDFPVDQTFQSHVKSSIFLSNTIVPLLALRIIERTKSLKLVSVLRDRELAANCEFFERYALNY